MTILRAIAWNLVEKYFCFSEIPKPIRCRKIDRASISLECHFAFSSSGECMENKLHSECVVSFPVVPALLAVVVFFLFYFFIHSPNATRINSTQSHKINFERHFVQITKRTSTPTSNNARTHEHVCHISIHVILFYVFWSFFVVTFRLPQYHRRTVISTTIESAAQIKPNIVNTSLSLSLSLHAMPPAASTAANHSTLAYIYSHLIVCYVFSFHFAGRLITTHPHPHININIYTHQRRVWFR